MNKVVSIVFYEVGREHSKEVLHIYCSLQPHINVKETVLSSIAHYPRVNDCRVVVTYGDGSTKGYEPPLSTQVIE